METLFWMGCLGVMAIMGLLYMAHEFCKKLMEWRDRPAKGREETQKSTD